MPPAPPGAHPDLTGLSCRFEHIPAQRGLVLTFVVTPAPGAKPETFRARIETVTRIVEKTPNASRPLPGKRLRMKWPPQGYDLEARAARRAGESIRVRKVKVLARSLLVFLVMWCGVRVGRFIPKKYSASSSTIRTSASSTTLRMVLDCTPELADEIEDALKAAAADGVANYGAHRQEAAIMTCFTPSPIEAPPHPFHRRRRRRLRDRGDGDEGELS